MHIKFLAHGTGSAQRAVDYLLGARDHAGRDREHVEVVRGDPQMVAAAADSLPFVHRYSSAVIAWAPADAPSAEQIAEAVDGLIEVCSRDLSADDAAAVTAVQHGQPGQAVHVHLLWARVDLNTGKSWNPAPPGWRKRVDPLRDRLNEAHGWARPDDPARARAVQPRRDGREQIREQIHERVAQAVAQGEIRDRDGMVAWLRKAGYQVSRQTKTSISVEAGGRPCRLTGEWFTRDWRGSAIRGLVEVEKVAAANRKTPGSSRKTPASEGETRHEQRNRASSQPGDRSPGARLEQASRGLERAAAATERAADGRRSALERARAGMGQLVRAVGAAVRRIGGVPVAVRNEDPDDWRRGHGQSRGRGI